MAKQSTIEAPPFKTPAPIEDDGITILANASRSGGGAIDAPRKHLVSHSDASIADLKSMLMAASLSLADGTLRTTRTQTLAVLKFVKAKQPSVGVVTVRNSERGLTTPMRANSTGHPARPGGCHPFPDTLPVRLAAPPKRRRRRGHAALSGDTRIE